jgi:putative transposase
MPRRRFTDSQIAMVVRELDNGAKAADMARKLGVSEQTIDTWKKRFAGMGTTEIRRLRQLEEENSRLKKLVAELSLDKVMLQDVLSKKF